MNVDVRKGTEIAKPPADVYRLITTDHSRSHPLWDAWLIDFKHIDLGPIAVGTRFAYKTKALGPISQTMELVVTHMEVDRQFAFRLSGRSQSSITYTLQPVGAGRHCTQIRRTL